MEDNTTKIETLEEMTKRLTLKKEVDHTPVKIKSHAEEVAEYRQMDADIAEMGKRLPYALTDKNGKVYLQTKEDQKVENARRFRNVMTGNEQEFIDIDEADQLIAEGIIEEIEGTYYNETEVTLPSWL